jgi:hypothetical protein
VCIAWYPHRLNYRLCPWLRQARSHCHRHWFLRRCGYQAIHTVQLRCVRTRQQRQYWIECVHN